MCIPNFKTLVYFQSAWYTNFCLVFKKKIYILGIFFSQGFIETLHQIICYTAKHEERNHSGVKLLNLYMKKLMVLLNMGVSMHFEQAQSETGRELRCATELRFWYVFLVSQCIHPMFGKLRMKVAGDL